MCIKNYLDPPSPCPKNKNETLKNKINTNVCYQKASNLKQSRYREYVYTATAAAAARVSIVSHTHFWPFKYVWKDTKSSFKHHWLVNRIDGREGMMERNDDIEIEGEREMASGNERCQNCIILNNGSVTTTFLFFYPRIWRLSPTHTFYFCSPSKTHKQLNTLLILQLVYLYRFEKFSTFSIIHDC